MPSKPEWWVVIGPDGEAVSVPRETAFGAWALAWGHADRQEGGVRTKPTAFADSPEAIQRGYRLRRVGILDEE